MVSVVGIFVCAVCWTVSDWHSATEIHHTIICAAATEYVHISAANRSIKRSSIKHDLYCEKSGRLAFH